jgi:hypothetical protein
VSSRLLFVPDYRFTPATCERLSATRSALDDLRQRFEVAVFDWYAGAANPTVRGVVQRLKEELAGNDHLLTTSGNAAFGLLAASGSQRLATFSCDGICVPAATLRAVGMHSMADGAIACLRIDLLRGQGLLALLEGAGESEADRVVKLVSEEADWAFIEDLMADYSTVDLAVIKPQLAIPALYLEPAAHFSGWVEMSEAFLRFAPNCSLLRLELWPRRVHDPHAGHELAEQVISFIEAVEGNAEPQSATYQDSATSSTRSSDQ